MRPTLPLLILAALTGCEREAPAPEPAERPTQPDLAARPSPEPELPRFDALPHPAADPAVAQLEVNQRVWALIPKDAGLTRWGLSQGAFERYQGDHVVVRTSARAVATPAGFVQPRRDPGRLEPGQAVRAFVDGRVSAGRVVDDAGAATVRVALAVRNEEKVVDVGREDLLRLDRLSYGMGAPVAYMAKARRGTKLFVGVAVAESDAHVWFVDRFGALDRRPKDTLVVPDPSRRFEEGDAVLGVRTAGDKRIEGAQTAIVAGVSPHATVYQILWANTRRPVPLPWTSVMAKKTPSDAPPGDDNKKPNP